MDLFFKQILIPVDLTENTAVSIKKALTFAEKDTNMTLLYVHKFSKIDIGGMVQRYFFDLTQLPEYMQLEVKLNEWKAHMFASRKDIKVSTWITIDDSIQNGIERTAIELNADLILVAKKSHDRIFPVFQNINPRTLSQHTRTTVFSFKRNNTNTKTNIMVLPITSESIIQKKELISAVSKKFQSTIQLIAFMDDGYKSTSAYSSSLLQIYKWLKTTNCVVEYKVLRGNKKMRPLFKYAERINGDILLINPQKEINAGWPAKCSPDKMPADANMLLRTG